jgi:4'-phosphopantetheinyl transferase
LDGFLNFFCAPIEKQQIAATPKAQRMRAVMSFWTLKEAFGKAIGHGLYYPLTSYGFTLCPPALIQAPKKVERKRWLFRTFSPTSDHVAALAVHHGVNPPPTISMEHADLKAVWAKSAKTSERRPHHTKL